MGKVALYEAKNKLTQVVRRAESGELVEVTRHGKPVAVLMGMESYASLMKREKRFSLALEGFYEEWPAEPGIPYADPFEGLRSRDPGRSFEP